MIPVFRRVWIRVVFVLAVTVPAAGAEEVVVSAAASLTDAFRDIESAFEAAHPDVDVVLNLASTGVLYRQISQDAPVDVFAAANPKWMARAVADGFTTAAAVVVFARNTLVLAVPAENAAGIRRLDDLSRDKVQRIGIGSPATVPAGAYARKALAAQGIYQGLQPKLIFCEHVRQVLDYLARGELDGGFIYRTDARRAGADVVNVAEVPLAQPITYPIAVLTGRAVSDRAQVFVDFVTGAKCAALLAARGFQPPDSGVSTEGVAPFR